MTQQIAPLDLPPAQPACKPTPKPQPATETATEQALRFRREAAEIRAQLRREGKI